MCKSLKATYTFGHKIKLTFNCQQIWKIKKIPGRSSHEKNMVANTEVQSGSCVKYSIFGD